MRPLKIPRVSEEAEYCGADKRVFILSLEGWNAFIQAIEAANLPDERHVCLLSEQAP